MNNCWYLVPLKSCKIHSLASRSLFGKMHGSPPSFVMTARLWRYYYSWQNWQIQHKTSHLYTRQLFLSNWIKALRFSPKSDRHRHLHPKIVVYLDQLYWPFKDCSLSIHIIYRRLNSLFIYLFYGWFFFWTTEENEMNWL